MIRIRKMRWLGQLASQPSHNLAGAVAGWLAGCLPGWLLAGWLAGWQASTPRRWARTAPGRLKPARGQPASRAARAGWLKSLAALRSSQAGWLAGESAVPHPSTSRALCCLTSELSVCLSDWTQLVKASAAFAHSLGELTPTPNAWNTTNGHYWQTWYSKGRAGSGNF